MPSSPSRLLQGTRTSSKNSSEVSWAFMPTFFSNRPLLKPGVSASTRIRLVPLAPPAGSVFATTITRSERYPLVMNVFEPLMM